LLSYIDLVNIINLNFNQFYQNNSLNIYNFIFLVCYLNLVGHKLNIYYFFRILIMYYFIYEFIRFNFMNLVDCLYMLLNFILILITNLINSNTMIDISFVFMSTLIFLIRFFIMRCVNVMGLFIFIEEFIVSIVLLNIYCEIFGMLIYRVNL
jgi:hypothetical protein